MKPLSTLDTLFATMETARWPLHGGGVLIIDPSSAPSGLSFIQFVEHIRRALPDLPPMRRRLVQVPFGLSDPYWVEDPDFRLERHLHRVAVPAPSGAHELQELVSQLGDPPLDFSRPLWDIWYIEGLANGRIGVYIKMHHACVDGMGGLAMIRALFTNAADERPLGSVDEWVPERVPSPPELALRALPATIARPFRAATAVAGMARALAPGVVQGLVGHSESADRESMPSVGLFGGPIVPLSTVTPGQLRRSMGWVGIPLEDIAEVRNLHGGTLNDVALAMCGGALRAYLVKRGQLPEQSLTAFNPVNMRTEGPEGEPRNQFSLLLTALHTEIADPLERLGAISHRMDRSKTTLRKVKRNPVEDIFTVLTPGLVSSLANLATSSVVPELRAPANLCVTNVAFTQEDLYFAGAKVEDFYIMMMQSLGLGLVVALVSYAGRLHVAITANRDAVDDPQEIADGCAREIAVMVAANPR